MKTQHLQPAAAIAVLSFLGFASSHGATLANYDIGDGSLGPNLFFDLATTGGNDETGEGYVMKYSGLWDVGDTVTLTGIAIPIWTDGTTTNTGNNTRVGGDFTISFYGLGPDGVFSGASNETLLGTNTVSFSSGGSPLIDAYAANFDTPTVFTADSTGIAIHLDYSLNLRLKSAGLAATGNRLNLSNGAAQSGRDVLLTLAGTAVPEPSAALLGALGLLGLLRRRR